MSGEEELPPLDLTTRLTALHDETKANAAVAKAVGTLMVDYDGCLDDLVLTRVAT